MRIGVIGTGDVGSTLAAGWASAGHGIVLGSRHPDREEVRRLARAVGGTPASQAEAAADAEVVVLATPWDAAEETVSGLGDLGERILVDCTNPLAPDLSGLVVGHGTSGAERIAEAATGGRVVKCFNSTGTENMADPRYEEGRLAMFLCGDDEGARGTVAGLAEDLGFEAVDCGPLRSARYLEPLAMLYITLAYPMGRGRSFGFRIVERDPGA